MCRLHHYSSLADKNKDVLTLLAPQSSATAYKLASIHALMLGYSYVLKVHMRVLCMKHSIQNMQITQCALHLCYGNDMHTCNWAFPHASKADLACGKSTASWRKCDFKP